MRKVGIIGGDTHIDEITNLRGKALDIVGAAVRPDQMEWARQTLQCPLVTQVSDLLAGMTPDVVAIANENDLKAPAILAALRTGSDVVVDKPLALTMAEQRQIEDWLIEHPRQKLLMLLTLRGDPAWSGLRNLVQAGMIGNPAFTHVRMAVRLKRAQRPPWFLDVRRSGGLFLDLLIHGLDQVEWLTGKKIIAVTANMGNLGCPEDGHLRDHAAVYCELEDGSAAVVEGQRMLPDTKSSDYRVHVAGTHGYADLSHETHTITMTSPAGADQAITELPAPVAVVADWLSGGALVGQAASLRANHLALQATLSARLHKRIDA